MSFKKNIVANYVSQIYATLIGIVILPLYIRFMGAEAYGLVGFFAMLQAWFALLDVGLTPTLARETARFRGGALGALDFRRLVRALEAVFVAVACVAGGALFAGAGYVARSWLQSSHLPISQIERSIQFMAIIIALRWMAGLYRGVISGAERLVWLSGYNSTIATARSLLVLPLLAFVSASPTAFFAFQLGVAVIELSGIFLFAQVVMPQIPGGHRLSWDLAPLRPVLKFSLTIAFTASVWVVITQTDKLILSKILPLAEYGYFTLAVLVASGVMMISGPVSAALMPRMAKLHAEGDEAGLYALYHHTTQLAAVIAIPTCLVLAFFPESIVWAWTGDAVTAHHVAPVLRLYGLGNGILVLAAFPYYLQYAKGDLRLHVQGNILFAALLIPSLIMFTWKYGAIGAAYTWLTINAISFLAWIPVVHRRFLQGLHRQWLGRDVTPILTLSTVAVVALYALLPRSADRVSALWVVAIPSFVVPAFGALGSSLIRTALRGKLIRLNIRWTVPGR